MQLERGSTMAKGPTGTRKVLHFFEQRTAQVHRRQPNGGTLLEAKPTLWTFQLEDAPAANGAIRVLFDHLLIPLFMGAPPELKTFFTLSKEKRKAECKKNGGMDRVSATQYQRILAVAHVLSMLDVWRRNTGHFLI